MWRWPPLSSSGAFLLSVPPFLAAGAPGARRAGGGRAIPSLSARFQQRRVSWRLAPSSNLPRDAGGGRCADGERVGRCSCRSEEHTSELQSRLHLVCRLLLVKK